MKNLNLLLLLILASSSSISYSELALARSKREVKLQNFFGRFEDLWKSVLHAPTTSSSSRTVVETPAPGVFEITRQNKTADLGLSGTRVTSSRQYYDTLRSMFDKPIDSSDTAPPQVAESAFGSSPSYTITSAEEKQAAAAPAVGSDLRHALVSLGLLGDSVPTHEPGTFRISSLFPEFSSSLSSRGSGGWWTGANVCVVKREEDLSVNGTDVGAEAELNATETLSIGTEGMSLFESIGGIRSYSTRCQHLPDAFICTTELRDGDVHKQYHVEYRCCHGWNLNEAGTECSEVREMVDVETTLKNLNLNVFLDDIRQAGLLETLETQNMTIFAVNDEKLQEAGLSGTNLVDSNASTFDATSSEIKSILWSHIVDGVHATSSFRDEERLTTLQNTTLRINVFLDRPRITTANCARILTSNSYTSNGIVHVVDRVLQPVRRNLLDLLREDENLSRFLQLVEADDELKMVLERDGGDLTLFAPSNEALERLEAANTVACPSKILRAHVLEYVLCSVVPIEGRVGTRNMLGRRLILTPGGNASAEFYVEEYEVLDSDRMATNGVLHVLDGVIVPQQAKLVSDLLNNTLGLTQFVQVLDASANAPAIDTLKDVTIFVPSNRALISAGEELAKLSPDQLNQLLSYHIVQGNYASRDLYNGLTLQSKDSFGTAVRIRSSPQLLYGRSISVQCASVINVNARACGAIVHEIDQVLQRPTDDVIGVLQATGEHSKFIELIQLGEMEQRLRDVEGITLLAPNDSAFEAIQAQVDELVKEPKKLRTLIRSHVLETTICCNQIPRDSIFQIRRYLSTMELGTRLIARRSINGGIVIGGANVVKCDEIATNGNVFTLDEVIIPPNI